MRKAGIIGTPVGHSLSPAIHAAAYRLLGLDWEYGKYECPEEADAQSFIDGAPANGFIGINITMPYKRLALASAVWADPLARAMGGANVLAFTPEGPHAYNTDGAGIVASLRGDLGIEPAGEDFIVCGTGPTAAAACVALRLAGAARIVALSRSLERAEEFTIGVNDRLGAQVPVEAASYADAPMLLSEIYHVVDATSLGMKPGDGSALPVDAFTPRHTVMDAVYGFGESAILAGVRAAGGCGCDGLGMLVEQAALAIDIWMEAAGLRAGQDGEDPMRRADYVEVRAAMHEAALAELASR